MGMAIMTWVLWGGILVVIVVIFRYAWKIADGIQKAEELDQQWKQFLQEEWMYDPQNAPYWQYQYDQKFAK